MDLHPPQAVGAVCVNLSALSAWSLCGWVNTYVVYIGALSVCACWEHTCTAGWTECSAGDTECSSFSPLELLSAVQYIFL